MTKEEFRNLQIGDIIEMTQDLAGWLGLVIQLEKKKNSKFLFRVIKPAGDVMQFLHFDKFYDTNEEEAEYFTHVTKRKILSRFNYIK